MKIVVMAAKYTFAQFKAEYPNDDACLAEIFRSRYGNAPACPVCGVAPATFFKITGRRAEGDTPSVAFDYYGTTDRYSS